MTRRPKTARLVLGAAPAAFTAWLLLRRVGRDYEERGRLSPGASAGGWALYLLHAALTASAALREERPLPVAKAPAVAAGGAFMLLGSAFFAWGVGEFRSFEQMSGVEKGNLVTGGPYRYSRNPQVVGWGLALLGAGLAGRSVRALGLVVAFLLVHRIYLSIEERHLEHAFGEEYRRYRARTPASWGRRQPDEKPDDRKEQPTGFGREPRGEARKGMGFPLRVLTEADVTRP